MAASLSLELPETPALTITIQIVDHNLDSLVIEYHVFLPYSKGNKVSI